MPTGQRELALAGENTLTVSIDQQATLTLEEGTLTPGGVTYTFRNGGSEEFRTGREHHVQVLRDGKWYTLQDKTDWQLDAVYLQPGESHSREVSWTERYGMLPRGEYRLLAVGGYGKTSEYYSVEFIIE